METMIVYFELVSFFFHKVYHNLQMLWIIMDKFLATATDDAKLLTQIENLVLAEENAAPKQRPPPEIVPPHATACASLSVEEQIQMLRKQLNESHAIFASARDALASISFDGIKKHLSRQSDVVLDEATKRFDEDLIRTASAKDTSIVGAKTTTVNPITLNFPDHLASAAYLDTLKHRVGNVPPLATFFRVVGRLKAGIEHMDATHGMWTALNASVQDNLRLDGEYVSDMKRRVQASHAAGVTDDERTEMERLVDEEMAIE